MDIFLDFFLDFFLDVFLDIFFHFYYIKKSGFFFWIFFLDFFFWTKIQKKIQKNIQKKIWIFFRIFLDGRSYCLIDVEELLLLLSYVTMVFFRGVVSGILARIVCLLFFMLP